MGGDSTSTTNSNSTASTSYDPWVTSAGSNLYGSASANAAANPAQMYTGPTQAAFGSGTGTATNYATGALGAPNADQGASSDAFNSIIGAVDPNASVASYMNPYVAATLQPTLTQINQTAGAQHQQNGANATMAGAFGGTGQGVSDALTNQFQDNAVANATGTAYSNAYNSALAQKNQGLSQLLQAGSGLTSNGTAENSNNQSLATLLAGIGSQQQQAGQSGINTALTVDKQNATLPLTQSSMLASILGALPKNSTTNTTGTQSTSTPDNSGMALFGSVLGSVLSNPQYALL